MKTVQQILILSTVLTLVLSGCGRQTRDAQTASQPETETQQVSEPIRGEAVTSSAPYFEVEVERPAPDFRLINQEGEEVSLSDYAGSYVLLNFVYLSCPDVCPLMTAIFRRVQDELGDRLGNGVVMVSITLDPEFDTPARLKQYAETFGADLAGWSFLTGDPDTIAQIADDYEQTYKVVGPRNIDHTALAVLIDPSGTERRRYWGTGYPASLVVEHIEALGFENARQAGSEMAEEVAPEVGPLPDQTEIDALIGLPYGEYVMTAGEWEAEEMVVEMTDRLTAAGWNRIKSRYGYGQEAVFFGWGDEMYLGIGRTLGAIVVLQDADPVKLWTDFFEQFNLYCCG